MPIEKRYKSLYEDEKATYLKYKDPDKASADGHEADAEEYARKMVERAKKRDKENFYIGGQSGFKWNTHSGNKTWIENGKVVKEKKGKKLPPQ